MSHAILEAKSKGMIDADEKAGLMVINKFLKYNAPSSPNAFKSWCELIDLMPECDLLDRYVAGLKAFVDGLSLGMKKAIPNDLLDAIRDAMQYANEQPSRIQEQEQEQEQEKKVAPTNEVAETSLAETETEKDSLSSAPSLETPKKKTAKKSAKTSAASVLERPDDVNADLWNAFIQYRILIKKPFNAYTLKLMRNQCAIAGWTLSQAMERVLANEWIGFKASYVKDEWVERLPGTGDKPIMVKREDFMRDQFVAQDISMFSPEAAQLLQSTAEKFTRPYEQRLKPLKNVHSEENASNPNKVSSEEFSDDMEALNSIPDDFKDGGER
ncbi:hypothetical protein [uncultured Parasutterella sp.]|uniref:hypothetical protein n=1 Tax=uncultured Parasutterella sp. TaxID=1263098 RepID=UPI0025B74CBA|nr:hypothetical protein [uncultured Parasutterella sp.]